jgi:RNA polymerase sigma factor (TIGR02999 family)
MMAATREEDSSDRPPASSMAQPLIDFPPSLYQALHRLAAQKMRFERVSHTLQPTALVHEAWLRLADAPPQGWSDRSHFLAAAAQVMRHILVDHARSRVSRKRGAGAVQVTLDDHLAFSAKPGTDVLIVDEALERLAGFDPRQARILEMRFFAGMTFEEIAAALSISLRTAKRDWAMARAWLHQQLSPPA